jgi:hypothetical protein
MKSNGKVYCKYCKYFYSSLKKCYPVICKHNNAIEYEDTYRAREMYRKHPRERNRHNDCPDFERKIRSKRYRRIFGDRY